MAQYFRQCRLRQGTTHQVAFIPLRGAKIGSSVEIEPGSKDFWEVISVDPQKFSKTALQKAEKYRRDKNNFASTSKE